MAKFVYFYAGHTYVRQESGGDDNCFHCLAHPTQALGIGQLLARSPVMLCSRNVLPADFKLEQYDLVLEQMARCTEAPKAGGWREATRDELHALHWGRINVIQLSLSDKLGEALHAHPAVRGGAFFAFEQVAFPVQAGFLLANVYDIRRFTHPTRPNRCNKLFDFFRLTTPKLLQQYLRSDTTLATESVGRLRIATDSWVAAPIHMLAKKQIETQPCFWLQRFFREEEAKLLAEGQDEVRAHDLALWATTRRWLEFFRLCWLHTLGDVVFEPHRFFKYEQEVEAYRRTINKLDNPVDKSGI